MDALSVSTRSQGVHEESRPHQGQSECQSQDSWFSCTHTVEKDASDNVVEPDKGVLLVHRLSTKTPAGVRQGTQCATEVPHKNGISLYQRKKIWQRLVLSGQTQTVIEILQLIHPWCDDQDFGRVMAATRETSSFKLSFTVNSTPTNTARVAQHDHISPREHAWLKSCTAQDCTSLCP